MGGIPKTVAVRVKGVAADEARKQRAGELAEPISRDGYYPVSICWSSNIPSSWWEQMRYERNGVYCKGQNDAWAIATAPVYTATDFSTAIVRFPRTALDKLYSPSIAARNATTATWRRATPRHLPVPWRITCPRDRWPGFPVFCKTKPPHDR